MSSTETLEMEGEGGTGRRRGGKRRNVGVAAQAWILTQKNWRVKVRTDWKKMFMEIFIPVLYLVLLSLIVGTGNQRKTYPESRVPLEAKQDVLKGLGAHNRIYLVHSSDAFLADVEGKLKRVWELTTGLEEGLTFKRLNSEDELLDLYSSTSEVDIGVVFSEAKEEWSSYTIRTSPGNLVPGPEKKTVGLETCRGLQQEITGLEETATCPVNGYFFGGFLGTQFLVDQAFILKAAGEKNYTVGKVEMENYPKAQYTPGMPTHLRVIIPLYCVIPMAQFINTLLILVVTEKEDKIKDGLKMIGVSDIAYWSSWFSVYGVMSVVFALLFSIVMHFMNILKNTNVLIIFLLFLLFGFSIITFAFALTPFFHKPKTAGAVGTVIMQFTSTLFMLQTFLLDPSSPLIMPFRLLSSVAFTTALDVACAHEYLGGLALKDLLPGEKGSGILYSLIFLILDTMLYSVFAVYLDNVIPNEYGVKKHSLYFLSQSFWCPSKPPSLSTYEENIGVGGDNSPNVEPIHSSFIGREAFRIRDVSKTYDSWWSKERVEAVKGISLDIYEGQITALLGRNGAGKTSLLNVMTGLTLPTSGRCHALGLDVSKPFDMMKIRKMTGVCLQQDLLFPSLTVEEHLDFYGRLRGVWKEMREKDKDELLTELELASQRLTRAENLSGGQKRKLSVAIALMGDSKIILLDEPSAGVDPVSRRQLWSLLQKRKEGKVILLTTHFMDEADVLADRKAIIHNGVLKCVGSSLFLKAKYGVGYQLTVEFEEGKAVRTEESDAMVKKWIPDALSSRKVVASEVKYTLPQTDMSRFPQLCEDFENLISQKSGVSSYGVSMTTLTEVFIKIANDDIVESEGQGHFLPHRRASTVSTDSGLTNRPHLEWSGDNLISDSTEFRPNNLSTFQALCMLRFRRLIRSPQTLFFLVVMPVILVVVGFAIVRYQAVSKVDTSVFKTGSYSSVYSVQELNFAVSNSSESDFITSVMDAGAKGFPYSGEFGELLNVHPPDGTAAAFTVQENRASVRINGTFLHSPGISLNILNQYWMRKIAGGNVKLSTTHKPFPSKIKLNFDQGSLYAMFFVGPAFTFAAVGMVMEIVNDREKHTRNHLRVNGVSFAMYFVSMIAVYGVLSLLITVMQIVTVVAFGVSSFANPFALTVTVVLLLLYIMPCLLASAAFSYLFDRMETAQTVFSQVCSWTGLLFGIAILLVDLLAPQHTLLIHTVFSFLDIYYIPYGIFYFVQRQYTFCTVLSNCDQLSFKDYFGKEIWVMGLAMLVQTPIYGIFLVWADILKSGGKIPGISHIIDRFQTSAVLRRFSSHQTPNAGVSSEEIDEDVKNEGEKVASYFSQPEASPRVVVAVQDVHKSFQAKRKVKDSTQKKFYTKRAVDGLDLLVEEGEVFGLLGHNGAGKTTAMKLIIGEQGCDSGRIRLCGHNIESNLSDAFQKLGYCPQFDAVWDNITLREHIELYAVVRGVQPQLRQQLVTHFLKGLQIEEHADKKANKLSGGTKRKLSYCMSVLGSPKISLMDEPSTGMDVHSKQFLWNTVLATFKENRGAILTTHSMEEADALCTRIGIMVKGSLICVGSPQHLKSKFGIGYTLELKLKETVEDQSNFTFIQQAFPGAELSEQFESRAVFSIPRDGVKSIAAAFAFLEKAKEIHPIEEYSFSQTTLESVFLQFASQAGEEEEEDQ